MGTDAVIQHRSHLTNDAKVFRGQPINCIRRISGSTEMCFTTRRLQLIAELTQKFFQGFL